MQYNCDVSLDTSLLQCTALSIVALKFLLVIHVSSPYPIHRVCGLLYQGMLDFCPRILGVCSVYQGMINHCPRILGVRSVVPGDV